MTIKNKITLKINITIYIYLVVTNLEFVKEIYILLKNGKAIYSKERMSSISC